METLFERGSYSVVFAERRRVGSEWNMVRWNADHPQIGYHRLYYLKSGEATLRLYDRDLTLHKGQVYFIPAFSVRESAIEGEMEKYYIHFQSSSPFFSLYRYLSDKYSTPASAATEYLFKTVIESYSDSSMSAFFRLQGAMDLILSDFVTDITSATPDLVRFNEVLRYIDENYMRELTVKDLASIMNISPMYFANYFKKTFRVSPKQYVLGKRLMESQRLLLESRMSIKEIAYAVGFENENYFSEFFTAKVGISALKFRKRELPTTRDSIL